MSDPQTNAAFLAPEVADLAPLFPGYEIETLIATGGMGAVYRAIQKSLDRTVAIKILPTEFSNDAAFCAGFEAEAKAMARLNHPNLIGVYDFGEVNGMLYIIMEYVPGKSLFHSSNGIAIDPNEVIRLVTGICEGLAHAHENGILHRDIKPSNILLDLSAQPKIGDFGLARSIENKIQEGEEIFGTPHYTAPEVINSPQSVDYRADIFSVGVLLHELLTGRLPADDPRPASVIARCDPRFDAIIRRATNPIPEARYSSALEIAKELHNIALSTGPKVVRNAAPRGPARPAAPVRGRHPVATAQKSSGSSGLVFIVVCIISAAVAYWVYSKKKSMEGISVIVTPSAESSSPQENPKPAAPANPKTEIPTDSNSADGSNWRKALEENPKEDSTKETDAGEDHKIKPDRTPDTEVAAEPKFDVDGFFERARKIMHDRAAPLIAKRDENIAANLIDFERGVKRLIRKIDWRDSRDRAEEDLKDFMKDCQDEGNRIPTKVGYPLANLMGIKKLHTEFLEKQDALDTQLEQSLSQLSPTYILGLQKQIERLQPTNDPAAIALIEKEIEKTRQDEDYFPNLMLGTTSDDQEEEEENEAGGKAPLKFGN